MIDVWERAGMHFACVIDDDYPSQLLAIHQRPAFVMWMGTQSPRDAEGVAVVGSREACAAGVATAREVAAELADNQITVISGLAKGVDTAAHLGSLEAGGRTVAVIGTGLRRSYPAANAELQRRIAREGMVLSQFLPDAPPAKYSFPMRNAVMSGLAAVTLVVEATEGSGARMQARLALEHGRPVLLMSSLLKQNWAGELARRPGSRLGGRRRQLPQGGGPGR